jgi:uncharacterized membrane protein YgdD (TMEM256/DUF423 family)
MKLFLLLGSVFAAISILFGAFGAHILKEKLSSDQLVVFEIATRYMMYHSFGLLIFGLLGYILNEEIINVPGIMMVVGIVIFSGSLYLVALGGFKKFGMITPIGGVVLIASWLIFAYNIYKFS